jgi:hypothetical protein
VGGTEIEFGGGGGGGHRDIGRGTDSGGHGFGATR